MSRWCTRCGDRRRQNYGEDRFTLLAMVQERLLAVSYTIRDVACVRRGGDRLDAGREDGEGALPAQYSLQLGKFLVAPVVAAFFDIAGCDGDLPRRFLL